MGQIFSKVIADKSNEYYQYMNSLIDYPNLIRKSSYNKSSE